MIESSLLFGAETSRITEENKRKIEFIEKDIFTRSLGISRLERRNKNVRQRMGIEEPLMIEVENKRLLFRVQRTQNFKNKMEWIPQKIF